MAENCVFCKIVRGEIPVKLIYQNDDFIAFRDANPQAPIHVLVVPKRHSETILEMKDAHELGQAMLAVQEIAKLLNLQDEGFRLVVNTLENGGQTVPHTHLHLLGGRFMQWPPG